MLNIGNYNKKKFLIFEILSSRQKCKESQTLNIKKNIEREQRVYVV